MVDTTCVEYVTNVSLAHIPTDQSTQLTVLSIGFDLEHVSAELIKRFLDADANRIFCVVLPDGLRNGTITRVANALRPHLKVHTTHFKRLKDYADKDKPYEHHSGFYYKNVSLHVIDEGTSTRERCNAFQRGGVVVCSSRTLCADILHRRLSTELIGLVLILFPWGCVATAMHETITPSLAFCVEMLLRGVNAQNEQPLHTSRIRDNENNDNNHIITTEVVTKGNRPRITLLSNHPVFMQYLVQRHHIGLERFTHQMHIGDIELFPRFRLEFIKHFEKLASVKPLHIDRMHVDVNASTQVLDRLLEEIVLEVHNELLVMEERLERALQGNTLHSTTIITATKSSSSNNSNINGEDGSTLETSEATPTTTRAQILRERRKSEAEKMDEDSYHLLPRARPRYENLPSHLQQEEQQQLRGNKKSNGNFHNNTNNNHYGQHYEEGKNTTCAKREHERKSTQYIYKPWRDKTNARIVHFAMIEPEICTEVQTNALDTDLVHVLRANDPNWPFRALVESLLDVRHLRRVLRGSSSFDFLFALEHALEKRVSQKGVLVGHVAPPAALWTLSSHFADVVTVATERIGNVIRIPLMSNNSSKNKNSNRDDNNNNNFVSSNSNNKTHSSSAAAVVASLAVTEQENCESGSKSNKSNVEVIDIDDDDNDNNNSNESKNVNDYGENVHCTSSRSNNEETSFRMMLVPNTTESDEEMDLMYRLVTSWARDVCKKATKNIRHINTNKNNNNNNNNSNQSTNTNVSALPLEAETITPPAFCILALSQREMVRCVERLIHTKNMFNRIQLNHFLIRYQMRCGIDVQAQVERSSTHFKEEENEERERVKKEECDGGNNHNNTYYKVKEEEEEEEEEETIATSRNNRTNKCKNNNNNNNKGNICSINNSNEFACKSNKRQIFELDEDGQAHAISLSEWLASCDGVIDVEDDSDDDDDDGEEKEESRNSKGKQTNEHNKVISSNNNRKGKGNASVDDYDDSNSNNNNNNSGMSKRADVKQESTESTSVLFTQYAPPVLTASTNNKISSNNNRNIVKSDSTTTSSPFSLHHILLTQPTWTLDDIHDEEEDKESPSLASSKIINHNNANNESDVVEEVTDPLLERTRKGKNVNNVTTTTSTTTTIARQEEIAFEVESLGRGFAVLTLTEQFIKHVVNKSIKFTARPRLIVVDASTIHETDVVEMITGTHISLQRWSSYFAEEEQEEEYEQQQEEQEEEEEEKEKEELKVISKESNCSNNSNKNNINDTNTITCERRPCARVRRILLMHQSVQLLRMMEMVQDTLPETTLSLVKVQLLSSTFGEADFMHITQQEREAFQSLAHAKATLTGTLLADRAAQKRTLEELQSIVITPRGRYAAKQQNHLQLQRTRLARVANEINAHSTDMPINASEQHKREQLLQQEQQHHSNNNNIIAKQVSKEYQYQNENVPDSMYESTLPMIVFDEREFRSTLPYNLYSKGIDLVPLTLVTADYVLSPEYAIERKSVKDYNQSLQSGRIFNQLAALSRRYTHPICLIEFNRSEPFRLTYSTVWRSSMETSSMSILYGRTARLMGNYPQVRFLWARSPAHSAAMMLALKQGPAIDNVNVNDPLLTGRGFDTEDGELGAGKETAHYAARVLARFPGVTQSNIQAVMELSGSLAGLATISQESFEKVMGADGAKELFDFLHNPLAETIKEK